MKKIFVLLLFCLFVSSCASSEHGSYNNADIATLSEYVTIKEKNPYFVSYKYKHVRVDQVATLAALYCQEQGLSAYLRDAISLPNHSRLATFDCLEISNN